VQDRGVPSSEREELAGVSSENEELLDQVEFTEKNEDKTLEIAESETEVKVEEEVTGSGYAVKEIDVKGKETEGFGGSLLSDEDEWEGVESTELDEMFGVAASYVASMEANLSQKIPNEAQMELYGLYKVATEGSCNIPQPSPLKITARAKCLLDDKSHNDGE
jgi:acyl-CoA-binding protein